MRRKIETGLPAPTAPYEWAVVAGNLIYTVHVPIKSDGTAETGSTQAQAELTFSNLKRALEAAGASLDDVNQVTIYLTSLKHKPVVDELYERFFRRPYPVRVCIAISELPLPNTVIEVLAYANSPQAR